MKSFIVREIRFPATAPSVAGYVDLLDSGEVVCSIPLEAHKKEITKHVKYLITEPAALSLRTVTGLEIEKL